VFTAIKAIYYKQANNLYSYKSAQIGTELLFDSVEVEVSSTSVGHLHSDLLSSDVYMYHSEHSSCIYTLVYYALELVGRIITYQWTRINYGG
jgi:hypothetical protein